MGESAIASEDVVAIAKRLGQKHIAIADTMNVSALIDVSKLAAKEGIELHMGCRLRIVDNATERNKIDNKTAWYPKVWAKNRAGMQAIYALLTLATSKERFFYVARLGFDDLLTLNPADVLITTGDVAGVYSRPDFVDIFDKLLHWSPETMTEMVAVPTPYYERMNLNALSCPSRRVIITTPTLFDEGKFEALRMNMAIQNRSDFTRPFTVSDPWFKEFHPRTASELVGLMKKTMDGMELAGVNRGTLSCIVKNALTTDQESFLAATSYRWHKEPISLPKLASDPSRAVLDACKAGIVERLTKPVFGYAPTRAEISEKYLPRLKYELGIISSMGFCDYFLVVADLVNWARKSDIHVGPGRGSVGGSLIAYLMGITDIDPIRFDLIFERFINPSRNDLPDADLDFMSTRREEVIGYLEKKYGKESVAGITNYGVLGSASALKDVARVYGLNMTDFAPSKFIPSVFGKPISLEEARSTVAEISKFATTNPKVWSGALAVQNIMRSFGRHASGVIVAGVPVVERGVVINNAAGRQVTWDMRTCEEMGLVKLDILGLSTLDTLSRCVRYIKERHAKRVDLLRIPLDDAKTLEAFSLGKTVGVFQFEGGSARRLLKDMGAVNPIEFNDIVAVNALNRPGPLEAGLDQSYIRRKNGDESVIYPHPLTEDALKNTYGVLTFQEQLMKITVDLCGFSLSEADVARKAVGKKDQKLMASLKDKFVAGAQSGTVTATLDDGRVFTAHRFKRFPVLENSELWTLEEVSDKRLTLTGVF